MLSDAGKKRITALRAMYPRRQSALLPALTVAQDEVGYLSAAAVADVAQMLEMPESEVESVASFYSMFHRHKVGSTIIRLCTNVSCHLNGADTVATYVSKKLGISDRQTTPDGKITLEFVECLGACDKAPVMLVNDTLHTHVSLEQVDMILDDIVNGTAGASLAVRTS